MYYSKKTVELLLEKNLEKLNRCIVELTQGHYAYAMMMQFQKELNDDLKNVRSERKILD